MPRYILDTCPKCKERRHAELIYEDVNEQRLECGCGKRYERPTPRTQVQSIRYPLYSESMGIVVESRAHEKHMAKKLGFIETGRPVRVRTPKKTFAKRRR